MNEQDPGGPGSRYAGFESVPITVRVRVGRARCKVARLAALAAGDVIVLDRALGVPFDLISGGIELGRVDAVAAGKGIALKLVGAAGDDDDAGH